MFANYSLRLATVSYCCPSQHGFTALIVKYCLRKGLFLSKSALATKLEVPPRSSHDD